MLGIQCLNPFLHIVDQHLYVTAVLPKAKDFVHQVYLHLVNLPRESGAESSCLIDCVCVTSLRLSDSGLDLLWQ